MLTQREAIMDIKQEKKKKYTLTTYNDQSRSIDSFTQQGPDFEIVSTKN